MLNELDVTGKLVNAGANVLVDRVNNALFPEPQIPGAETAYSLNREIRAYQRDEKTRWYWFAVPLVLGTVGGLLAFGVRRCRSQN